MPSPINKSQTNSSGDYAELPLPAVEEIANHSAPADVYTMLQVSKRYKTGTTQSSHFREADLLQRLLRLEDDEATVQLRKSFLAENSDTLAYKPSFQAKINKVHVLLGAYEEFFTHFLEAYRRYVNTDCTQWPADADFEADITKIEDAATDIPHQNNAIGILMATVRLLKMFSDMNQEGNYDWDRFHALAIVGDEDGPGIGLAQQLSGEKVIRRYCHGDSMVEEFRRGSSDSSALGSSFYLLIHKGIASTSLVVDPRYGVCISANNALSLVKVLTNYTQRLQLTEQPEAFEISTTEAPQLN